jgi:hypothetical protein
LMRLFTSEKLHAHTSDACVQAFFSSLASWRERRKTLIRTKSCVMRNRCTSVRLSLGLFLCSKSLYVSGITRIGT